MAQNAELVTLSRYVYINDSVRLSVSVKGGIQVRFGQNHCLTLKPKHIRKLTRSKGDGSRIRMIFTKAIQCECNCMTEFKRIVLYVDREQSEQFVEDLRQFVGRLGRNPTDEQEETLGGALAKLALRFIRGTIDAISGCCIPKHE